MLTSVCKITKYARLVFKMHGGLSFVKKKN
jgi:hypothetical protein